MWTTSDVDHLNYSQTIWVPTVSHLYLIYGSKPEFSSQTGHKFLTQGNMVLLYFKQLTYGLIYTQQ